MKNRFICWLWSKVYHKWLYDDYYQRYATVLKVLGWRTAQIKTHGGSIRWIQPCFWWFN